jgi:hypothetical protein
VTRWGESAEANYQAYLDFLLKTAVIKQPVKATDVVTNDLIADIDAFDVEKIKAEAAAYKVAK